MKPKANLKSDNYTDQFLDDATRGIDPPCTPSIAGSGLEFFLRHSQSPRKFIHEYSSPTSYGYYWPIGCGKSTFLKALNRIGELEGKVKIEGRVEFFWTGYLQPQS